MNHGLWGHILSENDEETSPYSIANLSSENCFPLYSFLLAVGIKTVDFLSLDVESSEYKILASIPWDKVDIKVNIFSAYIEPNIKKIHIV